MKRRKPLQRSRKPIRRFSKKGAQRNREYHKARLEYLEAHPYCQWFIEYNGMDEGEVIRQNGVGGDKQGNEISVPYASEIHHKRGRSGPLLTDQRYFLAVCSRAHRWIHDNPGEAYAKGYMLFR